MKTLEKVKLRVLISFFILMCGSNINAQELKPFYVIQDTIKINNPIIIAVKGYFHLFLTSKNNLSDNFNVDKLISEGKVFLYSDNTTFWELFPKGQRELLGSCEDISKVNTIKDKYTIFDLPKGITRFYFGFTTLEEYDKKMKNSEEKNYLKPSKQFFPILFPICENNNKATQ